MGSIEQNPFYDIIFAAPGLSPAQKAGHVADQFIVGSETADKVARCHSDCADFLHWMGQRSKSLFARIEKEAGDEKRGDVEKLQAAHAALEPAYDIFLKGYEQTGGGAFDRHHTQARNAKAALGLDIANLQQVVEMAYPPEFPLPPGMATDRAVAVSQPLRLKARNVKFPGM